MMPTKNPISQLERWGFVFLLIPIRYHKSGYGSNNSKKPHAFKVVQKEPNKREIILATHWL